MPVKEVVTRETVVDYIRGEIIAFPGSSKAMLWARLAIKRPEWKAVFDELLMEGHIRMDSKIVRGRSVTVFYWDDLAANSDRE